MPVDPALQGHETHPEAGTVTAEQVRAFADAIGDENAIYRDEAAARAAGYERIPAPPTFVTRFRVPFAEAGLDVEHSQVLHGEQVYSYARPVYVGDALTARHRVASIRQSSRGGMAIMTIEQLVDDANGTRVVTGQAIVIVRDAPPEGAAAAASGSASGKTPATPQGEPIPTLTKTVTQEQIDAYADVSGDHNPIHVNPEAARAVGLDGTIAHGMLSMAILGQLLTDWLTSGRGGKLTRLRVRFQAMVRPGDMLTCRGVKSAAQEGTERLDIWIENQRGERVVTGDAEVSLA